MNAEEISAYDIFVEHGPQLYYDCTTQTYEVKDGRHRMAMLQEENIKLEMIVEYYDVPYVQKLRQQEFRNNQAQQRKEVQPLNAPEQLSNSYFAGLFNSFKGYVEHLFSKKNPEQDIVLEPMTIVNKMAIAERALNANIEQMINRMEIEAHRTIDGQYRVLEGGDKDLSRIKNMLPSNDIVVLEEREV